MRKRFYCMSRSSVYRKCVEGSDYVRERILEELQKIENIEDVKIIMAVESGSRAWGFASPDSDYDVRFIYVRNKEDYLRIDGIRDVIEWKLDDTLDINGWDIKKALQLIYKSNPTIFEWCASPIVYLEDTAFSQIKELLPQYFSVKKSLFHYWHMAETNYREYLKSDMVRIKKYFYVIRPLLAAKWILDKRTAPPMLFEELVEAELEMKLRPELSHLLEMKKNMPEMGLAPKIEVFNDYIERVMPEIKLLAESQEDTIVIWNPLNQLFLRILQEEF